MISTAAWRARRNAGIVRRVLNALAALSVVLLAVGGWFVRVACVRRREAALLAAERRRMADDLHDSIEQHLAGARILLSTAQDNLPPANGAAGKALAMSVEILGRAKGEIRDVILNLRNEEQLNRPIAVQLKDFAAALRRQGVVDVRCSLRGMDAPLTISRKVDLVSIVRQAVTNAISHGRAKRIVLAADPAPGGFVLRILNDGAPFDAAAAPGPEAGHFGLSGMRGRARRSGFALAWTTEGKWMCVKLALSADAPNSQFSTLHSQLL